MSVASDLRALGWRTNNLRQAVLDFQTGWSLGPALARDGNAGPATRNALEISMGRKRKRQPDFSPNFSTSEFACECGGEFSDCRRIWITRATVALAERIREDVGPYSPLRACRCPGQNKRVAGARNSQHLHGRALDIPLFQNITVSKVRGYRMAAGIGYYVIGGRQIVRHVDTRPSNGTIAAPALWVYGNYSPSRHGQVRAPRPVGTDKPPPPPPPPPTAPPVKDVLDMTPDELREIIREVLHGEWRTLMTGTPMFKDVTTPNRGESPDEERVPLGRLIEINGHYLRDLTEREQDVDLDALREAVTQGVQEALGRVEADVRLTLDTAQKEDTQ